VKLARLLLAACALCLLPAGAAHAQTQVVLLDVADCEGASGAEVEKLAALELAPRMHVVEASEAPVLTGSVRCESPHARITVTDPARVEALTIQIDLAAAAPQARQRLLALALAELITTSQLEGSGPPAAQPAAQPEPDDGDDETTDSSDAMVRGELSVWVAPSIAFAADPALPLYGGELGAAHAFGPLLVSLDAHAHFGQSARDSSEVALRVLSLGAFAGLLIVDDDVQLSAGPGFRLGHAAMTTSAPDAGLDARDLSGIWLGPALMAALHLPLAAPTLLRLAVEGGYVAKPIVGFDEDGADRLALRGPWLTLGLGLALRGP
jgi:hypothetical protein